VTRSPAPADGRREARVVAQAKINLFLRVLAREASGYHQLETLFQRLELGDDVTVRVGVRGRSLDVGGAELGPTERNLAWRAAVAYAETARWPDGFAIEVVKQIPVGGGLGGGSADAGAVLRCLDRLAPRPLGPAALLGIAASLGADVPFLTAEHPLALAWGRGERMLALPPLPERHVHLALFDEGVATADVFLALAAGPTPPAQRPILWSPDRFATWDAVALVATNDLEPVVFAMRPDVGEIRRLFATVATELAASRVAAGGLDDGDSTPIALMTGSGATVFLLDPVREAGAEFELVMHAAPEDPASGAALEIAETLTATRVAEVELSG
jgi:4-diphosphocytidyl-2-C-methyl-D-erythritol kinase